MASQGKSGQAEQRQARLARALRENLKRRKAQDRARVPNHPEAAHAPESGPDVAAKTEQ
jgi:hypothetical protein